jgi:isochorismate synthase
VLSNALPLPVAPREAITAVTVPVPEPAPAAWTLPDLFFWWAPRDGGEVAALGVAGEVSGRGPDRFAEVRRRGAELLSRVTVVESPDAPPWTPRLYGGFAFAPGSADAAPWADFGDAWFALPRAVIRREAGRSWLTVLVAGRAARTHATQLLERIRREVREPRRPSVRSVSQLDPAAWRAGVEDIRSSIAAGVVEKIVYARRAEVELAGPIDAGSLLARLDGTDCFRFAVRRGDAVFAGASPERLLWLRGDRVQSEAMAGSGGAARALLESRKDRGEQAVVTSAIARALAPMCSSIELAATPEVRRLRHLMHLCTPVLGRLDKPRHLLELAAALHPTPAVGGEPTSRALEWIAGNEQAPRGWYAGAVGWFDRAGDGELAVALRSGLVVGARAYVWAGAGIVAESDPDAEYAEIGIKQRAFLEALEGPR